MAKWEPTNWMFHEESLTLELKESKAKRIPWYEVDLAECTTSAHALDWIAQVNSKTWSAPEIVGELVAAMDALLDFQGSLCGSGQEQGPIDPAAVIALRLPKKNKKK